MCVCVCLCVCVFVWLVGWSVRRSVGCLCLCVCVSAICRCLPAEDVGKRD